jgi:hypothetical protein
LDYRRLAGAHDVVQHKRADSTVERAAWYWHWWYRSAFFPNKISHDTSFTVQ